MTDLPAAYKWLKNEDGPRILVEAIKLYGVKEIPGPNHNPIILEWAKELGEPISSFYQADELAWCALFMSICAKRARYDPPKGFDAIRALGWAKWGNHVIQAMLGDVLVFKREGGGHVGIYVGEDKDAYHVLGGNQGNEVSIIRIKRDRLYAVRRSPFKIGPPLNIRKVFLHNGGAISENEA